MSWTEFKPFTDFVDIRPFTGYAGRSGKYKTILEGTKEPKYFSQAEGCWPVSGGEFDFKRTNPDGNYLEVTCGVYFIRIKDDSARANAETPSGYYDYIGLSANFEKNKFQSGIFSRLFDHYRKLVCLPSRKNFFKLIAKYQLNLDPNNLSKEEEKKYKKLAAQDLEKQNFQNYDALREYFGASHIGKDIDLYGTTKKYHKVFKECRKNNDLNCHEGIKEFFKKNVSIAYYKYNFSKDSKFTLRKGSPQINDKWEDFVKFISKAEGVALATYKRENGKLPFLNDRDEIKEVDNLPTGFNS